MRNVLILVVLAVVGVFVVDMLVHGVGMARLMFTNPKMAAQLMGWKQIALGMLLGVVLILPSLIRQIKVWQALAIIGLAVVIVILL